MPRLKSWGRRRPWWIAACLFLAAAGTAVADQPPPLRLCADPDNLPFSSETAATPGFYIEVGREIAHALGRQLQPVWVPTYYAKRQIRMKLLAGQCDGFAGVPDDPAFMGQRLIFSQPIVRLGYALVAPPASAVAGVENLHGKRVAVQFGTPPQNQLASENDIQMVTALSPEEAMQSLADGKADAAFIWGASAGWVNNTVMHGKYRVVPAGGEHIQWSAGIAFPRDKTDMRDQVDRALVGLDTTIASLAAKYGFPVLPATPAAAAAPAANPDGASEYTAPAASAEGDDIAAGRKLFNQNCSHCHGPDAVQGEQRRNLRLLKQRYGDEMPRSFINTVTHGRASKGMPNWSGIISNEEFREIFSFLSSVQEPGS